MGFSFGATEACDGFVYTNRLLIDENEPLREKSKICWTKLRIKTN
jgi:hypothetical protein